MSSNYPPPDFQYIAYIDEAGDPGTRRVAPIDPSGASEWLSIGAVVVDRTREPETVTWIQEALSIGGKSQRRDLHFSDLTSQAKLSVARLFATKPLRGFVLVSNKKNMRGYENQRAARIPSQAHFYNWCSRLVLERVTDWCERRSIRDHGKPRHVKIVFSRRGGHWYGQTRAYLQYLKLQAEGGTTFLKKREIKRSVFDWRLIDVLPHNKSAGLQVADTFASAFYQAAETNGPYWDIEPAKALRPRMTKDHNGNVVDYGVTLWPIPARRAKLTPDQQRIFRFYGFTDF
jgi:Protein of unknown function (DUF3800)